MRTIFLTLSAVALLSACADGNADSDGDGKISDEEAAVEAQKANLKAGLWERTAEMTDVKITHPADATDEEKAEADKFADGITNKPQVVKACLTEENAKKPEPSFFAPGPMGSCEYKDFSLSGGTLKMEMTCQDPTTPGPVAIAINGEYASDSYTGTYTIDIDGGDEGAVKMTGKSTMKNVGACPA